jgi:hypothetical protein
MFRYAFNVACMFALIGWLFNLNKITSLLHDISDLTLRDISDLTLRDISGLTLRDISDLGV